MKDPRDIILSPVVSEKSYSALDGGVYTFVVHPEANKTEIKDAVQRIFDVKVLRVNTMWRRGKQKRTRYTLGIRRYKPTTPGRRGASGSDYSELTRSRPEKGLTKPVKSSGGRNAHG